MARDGVSRNRGHLIFPFDEYIIFLFCIDLLHSRAIFIYMQRRSLNNISIVWFSILFFPFLSSFFLLTATLMAYFS